MGDSDEVIATLRERIADLEGSEERFRTICEHAPVMIDSFDSDGTCLLWNRECVEQLGYTRADIDASGDALALCYPDPDVRARVLEAICRADGRFREYRVRAKDGSARIQQWADFRLPTGALISVGHDVTEQRAIEQQLRRAQNLDALGQLTAGIAHDFNNLLTVVMTNAELVRRHVSLPPADDTLLQQAQAAARGGAELVRSLLAFSRTEMLDVEALDVRAHLAELVPTLRRVLPETVAVAIDVADDVHHIYADAEAVDQILVNVVTNARDAMPDGGVLTIAARPATADTVCVSVADNGAGMAQDVRQHAFDPFFSTKSGSRGSGLGLAIVYGFMTQQGGKVALHSAPGEGTTVELAFRRAEGEPAKLRTRPPGTGTSGSERVLVVEDEHAIRDAACAALAEHGYDVIVAEDGRDALAVLAASAPVDLVVSDVMMPNMTGPQLRDALDPATRPPFLFITGYPAGRTGTQSGIGDARHLLRKPWTGDQLANAVRRTLDDSDNR